MWHIATTTCVFNEVGNKISTQSLIKGTHPHIKGRKWEKGPVWDEDAVRLLLYMGVCKGSATPPDHC